MTSALKPKRATWHQLAEYRLTRRAEHLAKGLQRFEHRAHIVFYQPENSGVLIVRVLHSRMDVARHL